MVEHRVAFAYRNRRSSEQIASHCLVHARAFFWRQRLMPGVGDQWRDPELSSCRTLDPRTNETVDLGSRLRDCWIDIGKAERELSRKSPQYQARSIEHRA